jgi:hypothetical protein
VADERRQVPLGAEARDDVHMIGEHGESKNVDLPPGRSFLNHGAYYLRVGAPDDWLSQSRVPGDMRVQAECSMRHIDPLMPSAGAM